MKSVASIFLIFLIATSCFAQDGAVKNENIINPQNDPHFNLIFGISAFDGIVGLEYQNGHHSFGAGMPAHFSYRYYFDPYADSKFWGLYFGEYTIDDYDERENGILFQQLDAQYYGIGMGKRWQWPSGFNVTAALAIEFYEDEYSNPGALRTLTKNGSFLLPGIAVGYKF